MGCASSMNEVAPDSTQTIPRVLSPNTVNTSAVSGGKPQSQLERPASFSNLPSSYNPNRRPSASSITNDLSAMKYNTQPVSSVGGGETPASVSDLHLHYQTNFADQYSRYQLALAKARMFPSPVNVKPKLSVSIIAATSSTRSDGVNSGALNSGRRTPTLSPNAALKRRGSHSQRGGSVGPNLTASKNGLPPSPRSKGGPMKLKVKTNYAEPTNEKIDLNYGNVDQDVFWGQVKMAQSPKNSPQHITQAEAETLVP